MTDTLRAKQNMEILDVFKDLHSQIVGRQNKQIQAFPETLLPKTQRDLGAEVNTDKAVERINQVLETKLGSLEYLVGEFVSGSRVGKPGLLTQEPVRPQAKQAEDIVTNTGDIVPLWNSIVRLYQEPGLSRESQNIIKVKVQELTPNLEAMVYGLNSAIDFVFRERIIIAPLMLVVMEFLRTLSIYTVIKQQVDSGLLEQLSVEQLQRTYKNLLEEQSADRQALIKKYAPRGDITSTPIRNIPDFDVLDRKTRLKAIAEELGIDPAVFNHLAYASMTGTQFKELEAKIRNEKQAFTSGFSRQEDALLQEEQSKNDQILASTLRLLRDREFVASQRALVRQLEEEAPLAREEAERMIEEVPEEVIIPDAPDRVEFPSGEGGDEAFEEAMRAYRLEIIPAVIANESRNAILDLNANIRLRMETSDAQRQQSIKRAKNQIQRTLMSFTSRENSIREFQATLPALEARLRSLRGKEPLIKSIRAMYGYYNSLNDEIMKEQNREQAMAVRVAETRRREPPAPAPARVAPAPARVEPAPAPRPPIIRPTSVVDGDDSKEAPPAPSGEGRKAETRGLASLRKNYGFESMSDTDDSDSDSESDDDRPFDFDDAGNDMYYSKPMRR